MKNYTKIVLTGGPCGGKSSSMDYLTSQLEKRGYNVYRVPEVATLLAEGGAPHVNYKHEFEFFEIQILKLQMALEYSFENLASVTPHPQPTVILCDRGIYDAPAYLEKDTWENLVSNMNWNVDFLLHDRYDLVLHLVTTAIGAEEFYTTENNEARIETPEESAQLDKRFLQAWSEHTNRFVFDNTNDFDYKLEEIWDVVEKYLTTKR